jgi:hypothetical protein
MNRPNIEIEHSQVGMKDKFPLGSIIVTTKGCREKGPFGEAKVIGYGTWAGRAQLHVQIINSGRKTTCLAKNAMRIK